MRSFHCIAVLLFALSICSTPALAANKHRVDLDYQVRFLPESGQAAVSIRLAESNAVISLQFDLGDKGYYSDFKGTGTVTEQDGKLLWIPGKGTAKGTLSYHV